MSCLFSNVNGMNKYLRYISNYIKYTFSPPPPLKQQQRTPCWRRVWNRAVILFVSRHIGAGFMKQHMHVYETEWKRKEPREIGRDREREGGRKKKWFRKYSYVQYVQVEVHCMESVGAKCMCSTLGHRLVRIRVVRCVAKRSISNGKHIDRFTI